MSVLLYDYSLKLFDVEKLKLVELVVWVGYGFELFLEKLVEKLFESKVLELGEVFVIEEIIEVIYYEDYDYDYDYGYY